MHLWYKDYDCFNDEAAHEEMYQRWGKPYGARKYDIATMEEIQKAVIRINRHNLTIIASFVLLMIYIVLVSSKIKLDVEGPADILRLFIMSAGSTVYMSIISIFAIFRAVLAWIFKENVMVGTGATGYVFLAVSASWFITTIMSFYYCIRKNLEPIEDKDRYLRWMFWFNTWIFVIASVVAIYLFISGRNKKK